MHQNTHPIKINEEFKCKNCKKTNPKAKKTCRNHCKYCLYSLHVDKTTPGDRKSNCFGLMEPIKIIDSKKGKQIVHKCQKCNKIINNKIAEDDNINTIIEIIKKQNLNHY